MQRLLDILRAFREYAVLALLVLTSLILLGTNDNRQIHAVRAYSVGFIGALQSALNIIPNVFEMRRENEVLRQLNVNLSAEVNRLREARIENLRLRRMLDLNEHGPLPLAAADVVGKSLTLMRNTITLDIGTDGGVLTGMPIISESGLVGKVLATSRHYSVGQLMLNKDFRASAKVQRSRIDGIVAWDGGGTLRLRNVAQTQDVKTGDLVVTSEYSTVYPRDIRVGTVSAIGERPGSLFREIEVAPSVDFARLEQVFVVLALADSERVALEQKSPGTQR